jgi:hypothetical protein
MKKGRADMGSGPSCEISALTLAPRELFYALLRERYLALLGLFRPPLCNCTTLIVVGIAPAVVAMATALELAPYGPLGRLPVGDLNVEAPRVFKELQA